jgi:hypothetical protein
MPKFRSIALLALATLLSAAICWSQETRGSIVGKVTDPSGALIAGANVVVTNTAMGTKTTLSTNADGDYQATYLIPGTYQVEVASPGFKKAIRAASKSALPTVSKSTWRSNSAIPSFPSPSMRKRPC